MTTLQTDHDVSCNPSCKIGMTSVKKTQFENMDAPHHSDSDMILMGLVDSIFFH